MVHIRMSLQTMSFQTMLAYSMGLDARKPVFGGGGGGVANNKGAFASAQSNQRFVIRYLESIIC